MADEIEETFDKLKAGMKAVAKKVTDPDKDLGEQYEEKEKKREPTIMNIHMNLEAKNLCHQMK